MSIDQRRYVDIASSVVGATAAPMQKLDMRVMDDNLMIPTNSILEFSDAASVYDYFGPDSSQGRLAASYFSYVSPAPASRPRAIQFASHVVSERAAMLVGNSPATINTIATLGEATITLYWQTADGNDSDQTATVNFSGVTSYGEVAGLLTNAFTNVQFDYRQMNGRGVFVAMLNGAESYVSAEFFDSQAVNALGLQDAAFNASSSAQTMTDAYANTVQLSDSFGSIWFNNQGDLDEVIDVATLNASYNIKHQLYVDVSSGQAEDYAAALESVASVGLLLRRSQDQTLAVLPAAIMSATDYTRPNATVNYMYRQFGSEFEPQVTTTLAANRFDPLRVNYYGRTAVAGSTIEFFQRGLLCGGQTVPTDMSVHANEQWLKAYVAQQWFSMLLSTSGVPANLDGAARMRLIVAETVTRALNNGTILPGKRLSPSQQAAVSDASGDEFAYHDVQDKGYWYDAFIEEEVGVSGQTEYVGKYILIYAKGDWVRKVEGSHNLV